MRIAIMQPYLFPYVGYFQLIHAVDLFVLHDDVQWVKGGWINRNRILLEGRPLRWTLPIAKNKSCDLINQCEVAEPDNGKGRILRQIRNAYRRAPFFPEVMPLVTDVINQPERNVAKYILNSLKRLGEYLGLSTELVMSSTLKKTTPSKGRSELLQCARRLERQSISTLLVALHCMTRTILRRRVLISTFFNQERLNISSLTTPLYRTCLSSTY